MILDVIKFPNGIVVVFDETGEPIPEYQGHYDQVRDMILKDAPPAPRFTKAEFRLQMSQTDREEW
jgi:hypothetical protein